jgi:hypothetical protein
VPAFAPARASVTFAAPCAAHSKLTAYLLGAFPDRLVQRLPLGDHLLRRGGGLVGETVAFNRPYFFDTSAINARCFPRHHGLSRRTCCRRKICQGPYVSPFSSAGLHLLGSRSLRGAALISQWINGHFSVKCKMTELWLGRKIDSYQRVLNLTSDFAIDPNNSKK